MITLSIAYKEQNGAFVIIHDGYEIEHLCFNIQGTNIQEKELYTIVVALRHLSTYINENNIKNEMIYFESNEGLFCAKWLKPVYNMDIPNNLIQRYKELVTIKESLPIKYSFSHNRKVFALNYLDDKYKKNIEIQGCDTILDL